MISSFLAAVRSSMMMHFAITLCVANCAVGACGGSTCIGIGSAEVDVFSSGVCSFTATVMGTSHVLWGFSVAMSVPSMIQLLSRRIGIFFAGIL